MMRKVAKHQFSKCRSFLHAHAGVNALEVCLKLMENGLLAKTARNNTIRLSPPLMINEEQTKESLDIIINTLNSF